MMMTVKEKCGKLQRSRKLSQHFGLDFTVNASNETFRFIPFMMMIGIIPISKQQTQQNVNEALWHQTTEPNDQHKGTNKMNIKWTAMTLKQKFKTKVRGFPIFVECEQSPKQQHHTFNVSHFVTQIILQKFRIFPSFSTLTSFTPFEWRWVFTLEHIHCIFSIRSRLRWYHSLFAISRKRNSLSVWFVILCDFKGDLSIEKRLELFP